MPRRTRHEIRAEALAELIRIAGSRMPALADHIAREMSILDGYPTGYERIGGRGTAELTPTEQAAYLRITYDLHLADVEASWRALQAIAADLVGSIDKTLGLRAPAPPEAYCSTGTGRDGALDTWTPHSREPDNGWADTTCTNLAAPGRGGLCTACSLREDAWRRRHQLPPRSHVEAA